MLFVFKDCAYKILYYTPFSFHRPLSFFVVQPLTLLSSYPAYHPCASHASFTLFSQRVLAHVNSTSTERIFPFLFHPHSCSQSLALRTRIHCFTLLPIPPYFPTSNVEPNAALGLRVAFSWVSEHIDVLYRHLKSLPRANATVLFAGVLLGLLSFSHFYTTFFHHQLLLRYTRCCFSAFAPAVSHHSDNSATIDFLFLYSSTSLRSRVPLSSSKISIG